MTLPISDYSDYRKYVVALRNCHKIFQLVNKEIKDAMNSHDCGTSFGDGCEVYASYYEKYGGKDE